MKVAGSSYDELIALRAKTVFERAKLLAASGDRSRLDMTAAHVLSLLERFPVLYREAWSTPSNAARPFARDGFDVSDGWFGIISRVSEKLASDPNLHVDQLKEKWGRLTVYFDLSLDAKMEAALDEAADESERTCMVCGEHGTCEKRGLWVTVLCEPCVQLFEMSETCRSIAERLEGLDLAAFSANKFAQDTIKMELLCIAHAAACQPPAARAKFPGIDWQGLERLKEAKAINDMPVEEMWRFVSEEAPKLGRKLR